MAITSNLTTVVRNISGRTLSFGCLPRSKRLAPGDIHVIDGDLVSLLQGNKRKLQALHRALAVDKTLAIVQGPANHVYDETRDETKVVAVVNGSIVAAAPSWGTYSSSIDQGEDGV